MELKPTSCTARTWRATLLIVPYGIETGDAEGGGLRGELLIVPYGIETSIAADVAALNDAF